MANIFKLQVLLLIAAILAGCGYQLRGSASLPEVMSVTYIRGLQPYSPLVMDFAQALRTRNITVTDDPDSATAIITITGNNIEKLVQAVDSAGNVLEYEIRQTIRFSVSDSGQQVLLPEQSLSLGRDFLYTSTDVLAKAREEKLLRRTLQENLVSLAMLRIAALDK